MPEIAAAFDILQATQRRVRKPELIACPTCGRLEIDLEKIIAELEKRLAGQTTPVKISVLGCVVNGPGEAREADLGIAAGNGKGVIFRHGEIVRHVLEAEMVDALMEEIDHLGEGAEDQEARTRREGPEAAATGLRTAWGQVSDLSGLAPSVVMPWKGGESDRSETCPHA